MFNWYVVCVLNDRVSFRGCKIGNSRQVGNVKSLLCWVVVGKEYIVCDFQNDEIECKDVGRLFILIMKNFWVDVFVIVFVFDFWWGRVCCGYVKVGNFEIVVKCDQDVGRFDVEVNEFGFMNSG